MTILALYKVKDLAVRCVSEMTGIPKAVLMSRARHEPVPQLRWIAWRLISNNSLVTFSTLGRLFKRDHVSVSYGLRQLNNRIETDKAFRDEYDAIEQQFNDMMKGKV